MAQIKYEVVQADDGASSAQIIGTMIQDGGKKGWKFVTVLSDHGHNFVVFEVPSRGEIEKRG